MSIYIELPSDRTPSKLADWLEINTLLQKDKSSSREELVANLKIDQEVEDDQVAQSEADSLASEVFGEIKRRMVAAEKFYPFVIENELVKVRSGNFLSYVFCLLVSYFGVENKKFYAQWKTSNTSKKFEELSEAAIKTLLDSPKSKVRTAIFGYPRRWAGTISNPKFSEALKEVCLNCGEMKYKERISADTAKDAGLDIIAWKSFPDSLPGGLLFWGQCALGNDWKNKLNDVGKFEWFVEDVTQRIVGTFIPHMPDVSTSRGLEDWVFYKTQGGMLLNRCRIAFLAERWNDKWSKKMCEQSLKKIKAQATAELSKLFAK